MRKIPDGLYVYRAYDKDDRLLYVGASALLEQRMQQHATQKAWFADVAYIDVEECPPRDYSLMLATERRAIETERPLHNVRHNQRAAA